MAYKFRGNQTILHSKFMMSASHGNWTAWHNSYNDGFRQHGGEMSDAERAKKGWHAGYYVIVVILVYGMSIVMLIASHINRKHQKLLEDRQIDKYLKEFQIVKERSSRDSYRNLKKAIVAKLYRGSSGGGGAGADRSSNSSAGKTGGGIYRCISRSILPLTTLAFPSAMSAVSGGADDVGLIHTITGSRETLQQTTKEKTSRNEACLCNLYVIEEFEGEQKRARSPPPPQKTTARYEQHRHRCPRPEPTGRGATGHLNQQHPASQKCVTAEINIPPSSNRLSQGTSSSELAARYSPVGETSAVDLVVVDQLDSPMDDDGRHYPEGTFDHPQLQKNNDQLQKQNYSSSVKVGQCFGDSLSVAYPQRNVATPVKQMHSPTRYLSKSRSPGGARENHAYGSSSTGGHHTTDDVARRSSHSSSVCSRNTNNPVQISSV